MISQRWIDNLKSHPRHGVSREYTLLGVAASVAGSGGTKHSNNSNMMDKIKNKKTVLARYVASLASVTLLFVSCTNDDMQRDGTFLPYEHPLQFAVGIKGEAVTRATVDNVWGPNTITVQSIDNYDEENTSPSWSEAVTGYYAAIPALSSTTIVAGSSDYWQAIDEIKLIRAWCYGDDEFRRPLPNENNGWQIAVNQNEGNNYANSDFIYARTTATYKIYEKVMLSFYHQVAKVVVNVSSESFAPDAEITGITLEDVYIGGVFQEPALPNSGTPTLGTWTTTGNKAQINMYPLETTGNAIPQVDDSPEKLITIHANVDGTAREFRYKPEKLEWKSGMTHTYNLTLSGPGLVVSFEEENTNWTDGDDGEGSVALP